MLGVSKTTIDEVVLGELGIPTVESRLVRARLAWAGSVRCAERGSIVGLCGRLRVKRRGNEHTWEKKLVDSLTESRLEDAYEEMGVEVSERPEKRREAVSAWKAAVKRRVGSCEIEKWTDGLHMKVKAAVYLHLKKEPMWESYLARGEFESGGRLRFKARSGSLLLNVERGRRSGCVAERLCEACESGVEESVEHFVLDCPAYVELRQKYSTLLKTLCEEYEAGSVYDMWCSDVKNDRVSVVLGDCTTHIVCDAEQPKDPVEVSRKIRIMSNHFLNALWDARKNVLFSGLVLTSGAQKPRSGSAP